MSDKNDRITAIAMMPLSRSSCYHKVADLCPAVFSLCEAPGEKQENTTNTPLCCILVFSPVVPLNYDMTQISDLSYQQVPCMQIANEGFNI
jgi:hypothetical protein